MPESSIHNFLCIISQLYIYNKQLICCGHLFPVCHLRQLEWFKVLSTEYNLFWINISTVYYCVEVQTFFGMKGLHVERLNHWDREG